MTKKARSCLSGVRSDVEDEPVYQSVKAVYRNLPLLYIIRWATEAMAFAHAIEGGPVPLHPGVARFYREQGIDIPDHLVAE